MGLTCRKTLLCLGSRLNEGAELPAFAVEATLVSDSDDWGSRVAGKLTNCVIYDSAGRLPCP
jgi:hypothetical protein